MDQTVWGSQLKDSRGTTFYPDQVSDYWALLLEKAFAKFVGGYMNLEGGCPRWAVTYLSGGITTHDEITESFSVQNAVSTIKNWPSHSL